MKANNKHNKQPNNYNEPCFTFIPKDFPLKNIDFTVFDVHRFHSGIPDCDNELRDCCSRTGIWEQEKKYFHPKTQVSFFDKWFAAY
jgi:hypothetical protein